MITFLDLHKINQRFQKELDSAFGEVLDSGWYVMGEQNKAFEREFSNYCEGVKTRSISTAPMLSASLP